MDTSWLREGATAELAYADNGMVGSFYPCSVVQIADADALVEVGGLRDPSNSSNAAREWHPCSRLRPPPPPTPAELLHRLRPGERAELLRHGGWWEVVVRSAPGNGGA